MPGMLPDQPPARSEVPEQPAKGAGHISAPRHPPCAASPPQTRLRQPPPRHGPAPSGAGSCRGERRAAGTGHGAAAPTSPIPRHPGQRCPAAPPTSCRGEGCEGAAAGCQTPAPRRLRAAGAERVLSRRAGAGARPGPPLPARRGSARAPRALGAAAARSERRSGAAAASGSAARSCSRPGR